MCELLLLNPPFDNWLTRISKAQPLGLCYIASALRQKGVDVKILDCLVEEMTIEETIDKIKKINPEVIGFYTTTGQIRTCLKISSELKNDGIKTIFGGPFITNFPQIFYKYNCFDHAFIGEGEVSFPKYYKELKNTKKRKIKYGKEDALDESLFPAWDLIPMNKYRSAFRGGNYCLVFSSRGCPFNCIYCSHSMNVRLRSVKSMIEELSILVNEYEVKYIQFWDELFTLRKDRVIELCKEIIKQGLDFGWQCQTRVNMLDDDTMKYMDKAGCKIIGLGIESAHQKTRRIIGKGNITNKMIKNKLKLFKKHNIEAMCNVMFGLPGETSKDMINSVKFFTKCDVDYLLPHITIAYPNTKLFDMGIQKGMFHKDVWLDFLEDKKSWTCHEKLWPYYIEPPLTLEILEKVRRFSLEYFYLRPSYLVHRIQKLRSINDLKNELNSLINLPFNL